MLSEISIENFKCFGSEQKIPIRPITLIYGANSSGKSSIIHSLVLMRHAAETNDLDVHRTSVCGDEIDLGGFEQYVHNQNIQNVAKFNFKVSVSQRDTLHPDHIAYKEYISYEEDINRIFNKYFDSDGRLSFSFQVGTVKNVSLEHLYKYYSNMYLDYFNKAQEYKKFLDDLKKKNISIHDDFDIDINHSSIEEIMAMEDIKSRIWRGKPPLYDFFINSNIKIDDIDILTKRTAENEQKNYVPSTNIVKVMRSVVNFNESWLLSIDYFHESGVTKLSGYNRELPLLKEVLQYLLQQATSENVEDEDLYEFITNSCYFIDSKLLPSRLAKSIHGKVKEELDYDISNLETTLWSFDRFINNLNIELERDIKSVIYLGPYRNIPNLQLSGKEWLDSLNEKTIKSINDWLTSEERLQTPYEIVTNWLVDPENTRDIIWELLETIRKLVVTKGREFNPNLFSESKFSEEDIKRIKEFLKSELIDSEEIIDKYISFLKNEKEVHCIKKNLLVDKNSGAYVRLSDVGFGISQLLPILAAAYNERNKIVCIEQPEIHLHPALQADLADVFIQSALSTDIDANNNTFLIESHSENLLLRVMRRIRETTNGTLPEGIPPVKPSDVAVIFVTRDKRREDSIVKVLELDEDGQLLDPWPGGFFEEGFNERFSG